MRNLMTLVFGGLLLAGCATGNLPGHNHPDGTAVSEEPESAAAGQEVWRLKVAGAT